eukprot:CAMPEP_0206039332 /NCGR_PEP_ID=MMETSP1466-20131121/4689_1 /ASSEMBLY_ACC=CAM_ASM_001126 /TAXON_ID=44452 /ORGANISM="Pavlova gyrans, Strain CCMP608" /LENGTH=52 /DNA_ID=CAMNT_0053413967 /DNA_START=14 /DNA_END=168 /DNA_ORIENTATION=-
MSRVTSCAAREVSQAAAGDGWGRIWGVRQATARGVGLGEVRKPPRVCGGDAV